MLGASPVELARLERLEAIVGLGPGRNEIALAEAHSLLTALDTGIGYRSEKIGYARAAFATWFSARKWQNWGAEPAVYRGIIQSHLAAVRFAVESLQKSPS